MNRMFSVCAIGLAVLGSAGGFAGSAAGSAGSSSSGGSPAAVQPVDFPLIFDSPTVDLGEVSDAADISHAFTFLNSSDRSVRVELRNYCHHCEQPEITPSLVGPGRSGVVIIDIKTAGKSGPVRGGATIGVQGLAEPTIELLVTATVVPDATFEPPMVQMGETAIGGSLTAEAALIVRTPGAVIRTLQSVNPGFIVEAREPEEHTIGSTKGTRIPIRIRTAPGLPAGFHVGELRLETSAGQTVSLPMNAQVLPSLKSNPPEVGLGTSFGGDEFKATFAVTARDAGPLRITSIALSDPPAQTQGLVSEPLSRLREISWAMTFDEEQQLARIHLTGRMPLSRGGYEFLLNVQGPKGPGDVLSIPVRFRIRN